jgi:hypothetical protein
MLTPFDDYPIHPSADPIAHPATGDPNHYDRYWFNGHEKSGAFFFAAAMGHYPVRGVVDGAFSVVRDGVEHSIFASGIMPSDRSTRIGPIRIEVLEPIRTLRYVVERNEHGIECDLTFKATTVAVEEPRQRTMSPEGILTMDHTRLTQWGTWEGTISVDGDELSIHPAEVSGTRDRSWGMRPVGKQLETNRPARPPQAFWLWAPLHFHDRFTHLALHEHSFSIQSPRRLCHGVRQASGNAATSATNWNGSPDVARSSGHSYGSPTRLRARSISSSRRSSPSACVVSVTATRTGRMEAVTVNWRPAGSPSSSMTSTPWTGPPSTCRTLFGPAWGIGWVSGSSNKHTSAPIPRLVLRDSWMATVLDHMR